MLLQGFQHIPSTLALQSRLALCGLASGLPRELSFADCAAFPREHQVADVGEFVRGRRGRALRLRALFDEIQPSPKARIAVLATANEQEPTISLPLREVGEHGLLVYGWQDKPLCYWHGGPFHLILPGFAYAASDVPHLVSIEFAAATAAEKRSRTVEDLRLASLPKEKALPEYTVAFSTPGRGTLSTAFGLA